MEAVALGAMAFVIEGGSAGHPGQEFDEAEIDAETSRPLLYSELSDKQKEEVAARFPATALFRSTDRPLAFNDYVYEVTSDDHIANWEVDSIGEAMTIARRAFLDATDRE